MSKLAAVEAEAVATGPAEVALGDITVSVLPQDEWRLSAFEALSERDFKGWASKCLTPESYTAFVKYDPTVKELVAFFDLVNSGDMGKPSASSRS